MGDFVQASSEEVRASDLVTSKAGSEKIPELRPAFLDTCPVGHQHPCKEPDIPYLRVGDALCRYLLACPS